MLPKQKQHDHVNSSHILGHVVHENYKIKLDKKLA